MLLQRVAQRVVERAMKYRPGGAQPGGGGLLLGGAWLEEGEDNQPTVESLGRFHIRATRQA
jgi:hypothetical protein